MGDPLEHILDAVEEVRKEKVRGARWAVYRTAKAVIEAAEAGATCEDSHKIATAIVNANRSMAPLYNLAFYLRKGCEKGLDLKIIAQRVLNYYSRSMELLRETGKRIPESTTIMTISYSSSVEAILLSGSKRIRKILVLESRPGGEGALLAATLRDAGISSELIPDTAAALYLEDTDYVLVGADAITSDACLVNKLGTRQLSLLAKNFNKPVIVVFDSLKIHPESTCINHPIEERSYLVPSYGPVRYPLFDITPPELIKLAVTEKGIMEFNPEIVKQLWKECLEDIIED